MYQQSVNKLFYTVTACTVMYSVMM